MQAARPSQEPEDDDALVEDEDLEEVPALEKKLDPLLGMSVRKQGFLGQVEDVERGSISKEKLYRVRYDDQDQEHFTYADVLSHLYPPLSYKPTGWTKAVREEPAQLVEDGLSPSRPAVASTAIPVQPVEVPSAARPSPRQQQGRGRGRGRPKKEATTATSSPAATLASDEDGLQLSEAGLKVKAWLSEAILESRRNSQDDDGAAEGSAASLKRPAANSASIPERKPPRGKATSKAKAKAKAKVKASAARGGKAKVRGKAKAKLMKKPAGR